MLLYILASTSNTAIGQFWQLVYGVLLLDRDTLAAIHQLPSSLTATCLVVLLAGLSQTFGQSVILFVNRVRPWRFVLSVAIAAVLFLFNYNFWVISTWLVARWIFPLAPRWLPLARCLTLSVAGGTERLRAGR